MNFAKRYDKMRNIGQSFDKEKITTTIGGKTYNCYDKIQAANVDTDIYEVMNKYHCQENEAMEFMKEHGGEQGIYADIVELQKQIQDIGDMEKLVNKANEMFTQLPADIKQKYGNNPKEFFEAQERIFKDLQKQNKKQDTTTTEKNNVEKDDKGNVNETK